MKKAIAKRWKILLLLAIPLLSMAMHWRVFPLELISIHTWRQTQTQSNIDNFYEEDFNILNPRTNNRGNGDGIFRMEFPLMQWLIAGTYKVFGQHLILSRIANFIFGLGATLGIYFLIKNWSEDSMTALIGAWAFTWSPSFFYYTVNPLPDNLALAMGIWGLSFSFRFLKKNNSKDVWIAALFLSLAALCKLPFILYYAVAFGFLFFSFIDQPKTFFRQLKKGFPLLLSLVPPLLWYAWVIPGWHGNGIVQGVFSEGFVWKDWIAALGHNVISTLPELLLNYGSVPFFLFGIYLLYAVPNKTAVFTKPIGLCLVALLAYFFFELHLIGDIHDYYLFPFLPFLFLLVAKGAFALVTQQKKSLRYFAFFLLGVLPLFTFARMQGRWNTQSPGFNVDLLLHKEQLKSMVPDTSKCIVGNDLSHHIFFYYIHKKGWAFHGDQMNATLLKERIEQGAEYLYTDSRTIVEDADMKLLLKDMVGNAGSIYVYRLK